MGAWSSGLYGNDTTCDVRDSYTNLLMEQVSNEDAYAQIREDFQEYIGDEEEPLFWYGLAETQWKIGRLVPEVKKKALFWIAKEGGIELWEESPSGGKGWKKTLEKQRVKLESPMPKEKNIRKPVVPDQNPWNLHDVYAYQFHDDIAEENGAIGKYMVIQSIGEGKDWGYSVYRMRIQAFDKLFTSLPTLEDLEGIRLLPIDLINRWDMDTDGIRMSVLLKMFTKRNYPKKYLTYIGNKKLLENKNHRDPSLWERSNTNEPMSWVRIDDWLSSYFDDWQGVEYEDLGEGLYRYIGGYIPPIEEKM